MNNSTGYQSIPQDELEENLHYSSSKMEIEGRASNDSPLFSKQYKFSAVFLMALSCFFLLTIGILSMNMHSMSSPSFQASNKEKTEDSQSALNLVPCHKHCSDPCGSYIPEGKDKEYCCDWSHGPKSSRTCSLTVTERGECFCTADYLDYSFIEPPKHKKESKKDKPKEDKGNSEKKDEEDKKQLEPVTPTPTEQPVPPPWAKFIPPGPWNPWNPNTAVPTAVPTLVPSADALVDPSTEKKDEEDASKQPEAVTVVPTEQPVSPPWANFIPPGPWNPWNPNTAVPTVAPSTVPYADPSTVPSPAVSVDTTTQVQSN